MSQLGSMLLMKSYTQPEKYEIVKTRGTERLTYSVKLLLKNYTYYDKEIRGHPKMTTFSWVYKQYTFSDPLPPPLKVYRPTIFGFQNMGFTQNIYCPTTKINRYFKPLWYVTNDSFG